MAGQPGQVGKKSGPVGCRSVSLNGGSVGEAQVRLELSHWWGREKVPGPLCPLPP